MKKLLKSLVAAAVLFTAFSGVATAQQSQTCTITNSGQGSVNNCTVSSTNLITVTCNNTIISTNFNPQTAQSGPATADGNTNTISAVSGDASNNSALANELALACAQYAVAPVTPPATPPTGGRGGSVAAVTVLPKTGTNDVLAFAGIAGVSLVAVAVASKLAVRVYAHRSVK